MFAPPALSLRANKEVRPRLNEAAMSPNRGSIAALLLRPGQGAGQRKPAGSSRRRPARHLRRTRPTGCAEGVEPAENGRHPAEKGAQPARNFNIYNFPLHSAGCFRETKKHLRKTIRHLEKTTKHLEKIIRQVVAPSSGLFFGKSGQKETEEALYLREVLGLLMQRYNIFQRKANRPNCILTFQPRRGIRN